MTEMPSSGPATGPRVTRAQIRDLSTLRRAKEPRIVGGVAEGLSRHLDIDPLIIRVVFAVLSVFGGAGVALYALTWVTIPEEGEYDSILSRPLRRDPYRVMLAGVAIAALATLATMYGAISLSTPNPVPVIVIATVALIAFALFSRRPEGEPDSSAGRATAQGSPGYGATAASAGLSGSTAYGATAQSATAPGTMASGSTAPVSDDAATVVLPTGAGPGAVTPPGSGGTSSGAPVPTPSPPPPPRPPRPPGSHLFGITMASLAIALGILWIVDETVHDVVPAAYPATALAVIAGGLLVGAWWGRSRLLIVVGLLAALATAAASFVGPGPYGERINRPPSVAALPAQYQLGAGQLLVHLEDLSDPANLDGRALRVTARLGQIVVIVPTSVDAGINAHVDHGEIRGLLNVQGSDRGEQSVHAVAGAHDLTISIDLDYGQIVVRRLDCPRPTKTALDTAITLTTSEDPNVAPACN